MYDQIQTPIATVPVVQPTRQPEYVSVQGILERAWTRTMIDALLGEPDEEWENPYYRSAAPCRMYLRTRLEATEATPDFTERLEKANARRRGKDYTPALVRKYGTPTAAMAGAAESLFALNRYAKHDTCSAKHQSEIYSLKNRFIAWAVEHGHLVGWGHHETVQPEKTLECYCVSRYGEDGCGRCDFTGVHRRLPERILKFIVFRFGIDGKVYTWHQPADSVTFEYASRAPQLEDACDWTPEREKPIEMPRSNFAVAKALLRWVMTSTAEQEAAS
jgi:hypothetical protein